MENTIRTLHEACRKSLKKVGNDINVGDYVILKNNGGKKHYFISGDTSYVNPSLGIISSGSPMAQQILSKKFGEKVVLIVNGAKTEYKLMSIS